MSDVLKRILQPESVAVVGASSDPEKRGHVAIAALQERGYGGEIYAVNPATDGRIRGLEVFPDVASIDGDVDLAFVATPAGAVPDVIEDCGAADVAGAVVIAAGFEEAGNDDLQEDLVSTARAEGVRILGPNVNGMVSVHEGLNFLDIDVPAGSVALLTQSGNVAVDLINEAVVRGTPGLSYYVPIGNEADISVDEYLRFFDADENTDAVAVFVEGMAEGRAVVEAAAAVADSTPVALLKGGRSPAAVDNAATHTASLVGDHEIAADVLSHHGVVILERLDELLPVAESLARQPPATGSNVAILTDGGGDATLAADALNRHGLSVSPVKEETQSALADRLPEAPNVRNPVDILTAEHDLTRLSDGTELLLTDATVDAILLTGIIGGHAVRFSDEQGRAEVDVAREIATLAAKHDRPIVVQSKYADFESESVSALRRNGVPVFRSIDVAARCLAALHESGRHRRTVGHKADLESQPVERSTIGEPKRLTEVEAREMLDSAGVPVSPWSYAKSPRQARHAVREFDGAVAMKIVSREIPHKSDVGGVVLDVSPGEVESEYRRLIKTVEDARPDIPVEGVLISPMVEEGVELIVGGTVDPEIGPVITLGIGGIFVEVIGDIVARPLPVTSFDARSMIDDLEGRSLLEGSRGQSSVDDDRLVDLLLDVNDFLVEKPEVSELDLNPVVASESTLSVLDVDIRIT